MKIFISTLNYGFELKNIGQLKIHKVQNED